MSLEFKLGLKAQEIQKSLEAWARDESLLSPGEMLKVSIQIHKKSTVQVSVTRACPSKRVDGIISAEEWKLISELQIPFRRKRFLEILRKSDNAPVSSKLLSSHCMIGSINQDLKKSGLPLRLAQTRRGGMWSEVQLKLYRIVG